MLIDQLAATVESKWQTNHLLSSFRQAGKSVFTVCLLFSVALLNSSCSNKANAVDVIAIAPTAETLPVADGDDAADDAVILAAALPAMPLIIGTNKRRGLVAYTLDGDKLTQVDRGRLNNVDATKGDTPYQFRLAASNRTYNTIDIFNADLIAQTLTFDREISLTLAEPYGLCVASDAIYVGDKDGRVEAWSWDGELIASWQFASQTEGCVVDSKTRSLYVGEEAQGIWRVDLASDQRTLVAATDNRWLTADVEGLDIYDDGDNRYLLASSQGDSTYVAYSIKGDSVSAPRLKFRITDDPSQRLDGTADTDGIAIFAGALPGFPTGLLVVQDGFNQGVNGEPQNQNFKLVDWHSIESAMNNAVTKPSS